MKKRRNSCLEFSFNKKLLNSKHSQAQIIIVILIILIVIVGILIVWQVVRPLIARTAERISLSKLKVDLEIESAYIDDDNQTAYIAVRRGVGKANLTALKFIFTDSAGKNYIYKYPVLSGIPDELETNVYNITALGVRSQDSDLADSWNFEDIVSVGVAFVVKTSYGKEITSGVKDVFGDSKKEDFRRDVALREEKHEDVFEKPDFCVGINFCSDYLGSINCTSDDCEFGNCQWNSDSEVCEVAGVDPCVGISSCSDYLDSINCTDNDCNINLFNGCEWSDSACVEKSSPYISPYIWENGPSSDPSFFPIGIWGQKPSLAGNYTDIGINLYIGLPLVWGDIEEQLTELEVYGMSAITFQNEVGLTSPKNYLIQGWKQVDEPDNAQGGSGQCLDPLIIQERYNRMKSNDSTRPVFLNFGPRLADEYGTGRGVCSRRLDMYPEYIKGGEIISFDIYPVGDDDPTIQGNLEYVARGVERLVNWSQGQKIVWNFIETTDLHGLGIRPTPAQIKSEVWMSLIHGSMGIMYFSAEWYADGSFKTASGIFNYPEIESAITEIDAQIASLAPVLNSPTIENGAEVLFPIKSMVKIYNGSIYLFAVSMQEISATADFTVFGVEDSATAEVLGEGRQVAINNGQFQDNFDGYGVHLYKISPLRSRWYQDSDSDGYGDINSFLDVSSQPSGYVINYRDCNDGNANINPKGKESCGNGIDEDCDGADLVCPNLPEGYVSYWKFDEGSGMIAGDSAGKYDGSIYRAGWTTGQVNSALNFKGIDDYVLYPDFPFINPPFTISVWGKWDGPTTGPWYYTSMISRGAKNYANSNFDVGFRKGVGANRVYFYWRDESDTNFGGEIANTDLIGKWGHIAGVVNSTYDLVLYVNGVRVLSDFSNSAPTEAPLGLKMGYSGHSSTYWNGSIDEVVIFDRALDETEVQDIYCSQGGAC